MLLYGRTVRKGFWVLSWQPQAQGEREPLGKALDPMEGQRDTAALRGLSPAVPQMGREKPSWLIKASSPLWEPKDAPIQKKNLKTHTGFLPLHLSLEGYLHFCQKVSHDKLRLDCMVPSDAASRHFPVQEAPSLTNLNTKTFSSIYLYLAFLNIRWFLFSPLPPLYLLVFLFGAGLFLQAFFPYAYADLFNEHWQKRAFQPQHHWDNAIFLSGLQLNARSILSH